jgi:hydroxymethylbilane synthase
VTGRPPLRLGTRSSPLALVQARWVAAAIGAVRPVEIVTRDDRPAAGVEDKRRWVAGVEQALLDGQIDLAVHSAKDVPAELPDGLALIGAPARADPRDGLCGAGSLEALAAGARVGTSSLRRTAQLRALRPDLDLRELHGNVDTRLRRLAAGDFEAIVLAMAGLDRLGRDGGVPLGELVPAAGQGTLALEARAADADARAAVESLRDAAAEAALAAERALVAVLGAGCHTPVGAHARACDGGLSLRAFVGRPDGSAWIRDELVGEEPEELGRELAGRLLVAGAGAML